MFKLILHISRLSYILALFLALVSCNMPGLNEAQVAAELPAPPAGAWIDAPLSGAEAPPGTSIKVIGHVDPSVGQAMLYINGANSGLPSAPILNKKPPAYEWEWTPEQPGVYNLRVGGAGGPLSSIVRVTITGEMSYRAKFWADQTSIKLGECTTLHWETENALHVQLQGAEVEPQGNLGVCPQQDETQVLRVEYKDKHSEELTVNITILVDTITPTITSTPTPTETNTPTPTFTQYVPPVITTVAPPVVPPVIITFLPPIVPVITTVAPPPSDTTPPPAPSGLLPCGTRSAPALVMVSPTNLSWYPIKDASGISQYKIVLTNINTKQTSEYYTSSTSYSVTIQIGNYVWQVSAQDGAGNWGPSSQQCYFYYDVLK